MGLNDLAFDYEVEKSRWLLNETVRIEGTFDWPNKGEEFYHLVASGVQNLAEFQINNSTVLQTENSFRSWTSLSFPSDLLKQKGNKIVITFQSIMKEISNRKSEYGQGPPVLPECPPEVQQGVCGGQFLRKRATDFSWDWGPAVPIVGLTGNLEISSRPERPGVMVQVKRSVIDEPEADWFSQFELNHIPGPEIYPQSFWQVDVKLINFNTCSIEFLTLEISDHESVWILRAAIHGPRLRFKLPLGLVKSWSPNGSGSQALYDLKILSSQELKPFSRSLLPLMLYSRKIAFRDIQLDRSPDSFGTSFRFIVNDIPLFIKGANWVPTKLSFETLLDRQDRTLRLLQSLKSAGMNMLRVWGGGGYEDDYFYETAAELGFLIWSEFPFACETFPDDARFLVNVREEVVEQLMRIESFPSVAIFSGNNEVAQAIGQNWYGASQEDTKRLTHAYRKLFFDTVKTTIARSCFACLPFVVSSPSPGNETFDYPIPKGINSAGSGDVHIYDYVSDCWDPASHPVGRFVSEFGFQSFSDESTYLAFTQNQSGLLAEGVLSGEFFRSRQRRANGTEEILHAVQRHYGIPGGGEDPTISNVWFLSQLSQGYCLKLIFDSFKRKSDQISGGLVWSANDIWPAVSWSLIDYAGREKLGLSLLADKDENGLIIWTDGKGRLFAENLGTETVDRERPIRVYSYRSGRVVAEFEPLDLQNGAEISHFCPGIPSECIAMSSPYNYILLGSPRHISEDLLKALSFHPVDWTMLHPADQAESFFFAVSAEVITPFVWLRCKTHAVNFSPNGFLLVPGDVIVVESRMSKDVRLTPHQLRDCLDIRSLWAPSTALPAEADSWSVNDFVIVQAA